MRQCLKWYSYLVREAVVRNEIEIARRKPFVRFLAYGISRYF